MKERIHQFLQRAIKRPGEGVSASKDLSGADIDCLDNTATDHPAMVTHGVYVGATGDLKVQLVGDKTPTTFTAIAAGFHPLHCVRIINTGTTATSVKALW